MITNLTITDGYIPLSDLPAYKVQALVNETCFNANVHVASVHVLLLPHLLNVLFLNFHFILCVRFISDVLLVRCEI